MLARPGWFLEQHAAESDVRFNICYGNYDYVVLQEHAHPFGPEEKFFKAVRTLDTWIKKAGAKTVIYSTWAKRTEEFNQAQMTRAHRQIAEEIGAILAPVGENWWDYMKSRPEINLYAEDGAHASKEGSDFAAKCIWESIYTDLKHTS
jgi:lysophospholipase L1-like esterase